MRAWLVCGCGLLGLSLLSVQAADEPKAKKLPIETFTDTDKAGPDYKIQGEYVGESKDGKLGAQVVARGDGNFDLYFLTGGLPGAGFNGKDKAQVPAKTESSAVSFDAKGYKGTLDGTTLTVTGPFGDAKLSKTTRTSPTLGAKPPEGAVVLFDGTDATAKKWNGGKLVENDLLNMGVTTKDKFGSFKLHLEFRLPFMPRATGQARANSGVFPQNRYEVQILDSFGLRGMNNECGGLYEFKTPDVNMCLPPLVWQTYDMTFTQAEFADGKKTKNAFLTVEHNGVKIHDNVELKKLSPVAIKDDGTPGPIQLQNHGNPVVFRNIWLMPTK